MKIDLTTTLGPLTLCSPVIAASGTFGYGTETGTEVDLRRIGAVCVKGLTLLPRYGNPPPRLIETACGIMNSVGLENPGIDRFIEEILPRIPQSLKVIVNIAGGTLEDYVTLAAKVSIPRVSALEVNVSCPNVRNQCLAWGLDPTATFELTRAVKTSTHLPVIVKLTPNAPDIVEVAIAAEEGGADIVSLVNTFLALSIDVERRRPVFANTFAGLSGPAIMPIALRMVWQVSGAVSVPVIGMGGILNARDALQFLMAGASAVAVGSANLRDPAAIPAIVDGIEEFMEREAISHVSELVGAARPEGPGNRRLGQTKPRRRTGYCPEDEGADALFQSGT